MFNIGDDANSTTRGTLDLSAGTCTGTWTFNYASVYTVAGWVQTPSTITYTTPPITVTATGGTDPRCTGQTTGPATCSYHWAEVYYTSPNNTRFGRVCDIDTGCQWQTAHAAWPQIPGMDYWLNSGQPLPDGNTAEAYLCLGSSPSDWTVYTSTRDFDALVGRPETSASPVPAGTC
ncbi:MAG TPA: hypothetical protein VHS54_00375 [Jatrophihabitans sp.]|nr:hypothetical protein [Jatrophihabitans sp.]